MNKPGRFGEVSLGELCKKCTLSSPNIVVEPVCASIRQLWSVFWCLNCRVRGLINVSTYHPNLEIYRWNDKSPIVQNWMRQWGGWDG